MASLITSSPDSSRLAMGEESPSEECRLDLKGLISDLRFTPLLGSLTNCSSHLWACPRKLCFTFEGSAQVWGQITYTSSLNSIWHSWEQVKRFFKGNWKLGLPRRSKQKSEITLGNLSYSSLAWGSCCLLCCLQVADTFSPLSSLDSNHKTIQIQTLHYLKAFKIWKQWTVFIWHAWAKTWILIFLKTW